MFFLLTLPFRLLFGVLMLALGVVFLPLLLFRLAIKTAVLLVTLPFVLLAIGAALLVAFVAVVCVLTIPLLPFAFVAFCIWAIVRSSRPALHPQP